MDEPHEQIEDQHELDDRGKEIHEVYEQSDKDENEETVELYDPNDTREI